MGLLGNVFVGVYLLVSLMWIKGRLNGYFNLTVEQDAVEFKQDMIPDNANADVFAQFNKRALIPGHGEKLFHYKTHGVTSTIMGVVAVLQMNTSFRTKFYSAHKLLGYLFSLLYVVHQIHMAYLLLVVGIADIHPIVVYYDCMLWLIMMVGYPIGLLGINQNNIKLHRVGMIVMVAGLFGIPTQRIFWLIYSKSNLLAGKAGRYTSYEHWLHALYGSICSAMFVNAAWVVIQVYSELNVKDEAKGNGRKTLLQKKSQ